MSWRTVVITKRCKLDLKMGSMIVRSEDTKRILLDEISVIVIENNAVAITGCLMTELSKRRIKLIFCDDKHNPSAELVPLYGSFDCSSKIRRQINWNEDIKAAVWTAIVSEKIRQQAEHLKDTGYLEDAGKLFRYLDEIEFNDETNREGHAAKVYFNSLFGVTFSRDNANTANAALNYGYALIMSAVNREICACGYLTQLGLFHNNTFNYFNLSCDLMEPFRIIVDRFVVKNKFGVFETEQKHKMMELFNKTIFIDNSEQYLLNAIKLYCRSVFDALNENDVSRIKFYSLTGKEV